MYGEEKNTSYCSMGRLEQSRQDNNLLYRHEEPNEPTKEGLLSFVFFESPFASVSTFSRGHPLSSLSVCNHELFDSALSSYSKEYIFLL
jgi:hypothetical protein